MSKKRVRGLAPARSDEQVTGQLLAVDGDAREQPAAPFGGDLHDLRLAQVDHARDVDAGVRELRRRRATRVVGADHDGAASRLDRPVSDKPADGAGEHHADEVVAGKDERLLDRAGGDHDPLGADPVQDVTCRDGDEIPLVDAERASGREQLVPGGREATALVHQQHVSAGGLRGRPAAASAADDERLDAAVLDVVAPLARAADAAEAGEVPEHALVVRPKPTRPDHRAVVEADRRERPADAIDDGEQVAVE